MSLFSQSPFPDLAYYFDVRRGHMPGKDFSTIEENLAPVSGYTPAEGDVVRIVNVAGAPRWQKMASASLGLADITDSLTTITDINTTGEIDSDGEVAALTAAIAAPIAAIVEALLRLNGTASVAANNYHPFWTIVRGMQPGEYDGINAGVATGIRGTYVIESARLAESIGSYTIGSRVIVDGDNLLAPPTAGEAEQVYGTVVHKTADTIEVLVG